ncbi:RagB/SusD family nutrient uptake outer membrane protein, partial [Bacteroides nordii]|nr:RagB/SusD family nutrient uptake outer membrane protein [Bacteroides nordii]
IPGLLLCDVSNQKGERLSKGAAMGLLARAYLFRGGYSLYQDKSITRPGNYKEYYQAGQTVLNELISSGK